MAHSHGADVPETPVEQSRRTFMVNAVVALGGTIGLALAVPLAASLAPPASAAENEWSPLSPDAWAQLQKATDVPTKVTFALHDQDGYFAASDSEQFVWAVKADEARMRATRPELFEGWSKLPYTAGTLGFTLFSPICPHLGCRYAWIAEKTRFICPCHNSQFTNTGAYISGPARRGLDPLPLRDLNGRAALTWIEYQANTPGHFVLKVG